MKEERERKRLVHPFGFTSVGIIGSDGGSSGGCSELKEQGVLALKSCWARGYHFRGVHGSLLYGQVLQQGVGCVGNRSGITLLGSSGWATR